MNYQKHKEEQMDMDQQDIEQGIKGLLAKAKTIREANEAEIARRKRLEMDERGQIDTDDPYGAKKVWKAIHDREMVNHPDHYQGNKMEVIDIIEDYELGFHLGNAIKYILRADKKGNTKQDLEKAIWYIQREIDREDV